MSLAILDRPRLLPGPPDDALRWTTCLRTVTFSDEGEAAWPEAADVLRDAAAYARLLEIVSGLRSPLVGETQVLGQFKTFLLTLPPGGAWLRQLGQRVLADARVVRSGHLHHLGARTYGSAVRRHVEDLPLVAVIGSGALASEILPFVTGDGRVVDQWTRRHAAADGPARRSFEIGRWREVVPRDRPAAVVIAAPVANDDLMPILERYPRRRLLIDLRAEQCAPADAAPVVMTLDDVYAGMRADVDGSASRIAGAHAEIRHRAEAFARAEMLRPFGWDDLCA